MPSRDRQKDFRAIAVELSLEAVGHEFPRLSQVGAGWVYDAQGPRRAEIYDTPSRSFPVPVSTKTYGIFIMDVLLGRDGKTYLIEANGSNAALSSATHGHDDKRALHMFMTLKSKGWTGVPSVALMAYGPGLLHVGEFFQRAGTFANYLSEDFLVRLCNEKENLGMEDISVVCGPIPSIAAHCTSDGKSLYYRGRPVIFATNPNLYPELVRRGIARREGNSYVPSPVFQHEGAGTPIVHDKGLQQEICEGTGFTPQEHRSAGTVEEAREVVKYFVSKGTVTIGKINAGSGGTGIECFSPTLGADELESRLDSMIATALDKYGEDSEDTIFPLRFFEFATSTPYVLRDGPRLWDFRLQCLVYPGYVDITPCVIRLCPEPFNERTYHRGGVVANLSGRPATLRYMRAPFVERKSEPGTTVLDAVGVTEQRLYHIVESCARWCERAIQSYDVDS